MPVVQEEMPFKIVLIWSSGGPPDLWSGTIYAILKEGIIGNIQVKLFEIWTSGSGDVIYRKSLSMMDGRMDDAQRLITIAHIESSVQAS